MSDLLSRFDAMEFIILVAVSGGLLIGLLSAVTAIVGAYWACVRETQITSSLVQDMLDRGLPTEEIVELVVAMGLDAGDEDDPRLALLRRRAEERRAEPVMSS